MAKAIKRIVSTEFWNDRTVCELFTAEDKFFYLYLLTNPHTTQLGIYELPIIKASQETSYDMPAIRKLIDRFQNSYGMIKYSEQTGEIAIKNFLRHSIVSGGKPVEDCLIKELSEVKDTSLIYYIYNNLYDRKDINETVNKILVYIKDNYLKDINNKVLNNNDNDNERIVPRIVPRIVNEEEKTPKSVKKNIDLLDGVMISYPDAEYLTGTVLYEVIVDWLEYKQEIKDTYKSERSLKTLLNQFIDNDRKYGTEAVKTVVEESIANGYKGIIWDKLSKTKSSRPTFDDWLNV